MNGSEDPGIMTTRRRILVSFLILAWTCGVTLARAWRLPNDFAAAHWYLDYSLGFMKRALVGSVTGVFARLFGTRLESGAVDILSAVAVAVMVVVLLGIAWRLLVRTQASPPVVWAGLIFFSSPFLVMSAHLVGYFDAIIHLMTITAVILVTRNRPWLAAVVSALGILVHESFLLTGLPLVALAIFVQGPDVGRPGRPWIPLALPLAVFTILIGYGAVTGNGADLRPELVARWADQGIPPTEGEEIATWLTTPVWQFGRGQAREFLPRVIEPGVLARTAPALVALMALLFAATGLRTRGPTSLVVLAAVFLPLLMHTVAWDGARIATYPIAGAFLALWVIQGRLKGGGSLGPVLLLMLPVLFLNTFQHLPLMDGDVERFSILTRAALYLPPWILALFLAFEQLRSEQDSS
jgi:hypothetical protein